MTSLSIHVLLQNHIHSRQLAFLVPVLYLVYPPSFACLQASSAWILVVCRGFVLLLQPDRPLLPLPPLLSRKPPLPFPPCHLLSPISMIITTVEFKTWVFSLFTSLPPLDQASSEQGACHSSLCPQQLAQGLTQSSVSNTGHMQITWFLANFSNWKTKQTPNSIQSKT